MTSQREGMSASVEGSSGRALQPVSMRPPAMVMRLARLGSLHISRLSFSRSLVRKARREGWVVSRQRWDLDENGYGVAVYAVRIGERDYSLVAFSQYLPPELRIDRVIAQAWETCYVLYDGIPDDAEIARLRECVPYQEARRYTQRELVLARANKSERLFVAVSEALAAGQQPDEAAIREIGYLLRTSAVYGNGKFGIADWQYVSQRPEFSSPYAVEMLTVWLIRNFTVELVEHCAAAASPDTAVRLDPALRRLIGIGNATGLGMAPYLVRHPALLHRWVAAREKAVARVRSIPALEKRALDEFMAALARTQVTFAWWRTEDQQQAGRVEGLMEELALIARRAGEIEPSAVRPWDALYRWGEAELGLEAQECLVSLLIEPHGGLVDDLVDEMGLPEGEPTRVDGAMSCGVIAESLRELYGWALEIDFADREELACFWYTSQEKLEPRLGWRGDDEGEELELPLGVARDIRQLADALSSAAPEMAVGELALQRPDLRHVIRRVQAMRAYPYGEIRDNMLASSVRPIDLMRSKLAFLGGEFYDPVSNMGLRIRLYQGAPFPDELHETIDDNHW